MTLLNYLRSNWEGVPIYFNTIKFDDYFINIVPFMLGNKVVKYDDEKIYDNKGDLFITDNTLLVEKAKKENFSILLIGESFKEGVEVSKNIRLISTLKSEEYEDEELDIFEPFNLSLKISGFEKAKIFNLDNFVGEEKKFVPTMPPPPPPDLKKVEQPKFIPTMPPPPPPALKTSSSKKSASSLEGGYYSSVFSNDNIDKPPPSPQFGSLSLEGGYYSSFFSNDNINKPSSSKNIDTFNPPIIPEDIKVNNKTLKLLNDKLFGGTKIRVLQEVIRDLPYEEVVYAGPDSGMAQIAIGASAKKYGKKATMFVNTPSLVRMLPPLVSFGQQFLDIKYDFAKDEKGRSLYDTEEAAKKYVEENPQKRILLPFGIKDEKIVSRFSEILGGAIKNIPQPKRMWIVAGSGMLLEVFHRIWPKTKYMVVQVGKKVDPNSLLHNGVQDELFIAPERFKDTATIQPPYETIPWYDAKLWRFVLQKAEEGDYIWNVATSPTLDGLYKFLKDYVPKPVEYDEKGEPMYTPSSPYFKYENGKFVDLDQFSLDEPKFIPTVAPPPPPPLRKVQKIEEQKFIPPPPPPPPLRKVQKEQKTIEKSKTKFPFVPFVKGGTLESENKGEFKHANMINMRNNEYDYFPKRKEEYMYTDVSLYSSADVSHSLKTAEFISKYYDISNKTLTEASACIGGNSWSFADKVKNINLVEIDDNNFKALKHNMGVVFNKSVENDILEYKPGKNMSFYNDNYIKIKDKVGGDIIFYDPPWGGVDYKNEPQVGYTYEGKFYTIEDMAKKSFYEVPPELIVFRVPMTSTILESDYKYKTTVDFNDLYGKGIYKLIFLSDTKGGDLPSDIKVKRINYKKIEYDVI